MIKAVQIPVSDDFTRECEYARDAGFEYISVGFTRVLGKTSDEWRRLTDDIGNLFAALGLKCVQSHPHYYNPFLSSDVRDEELERSMREAIRASANLGAEYCVFHPRTAISSGYSVAVSLEDNKRWFSELLECAVKSGTRIAAENLPIFPSSNKIAPLFSSNPDHLISLVDSFSDDSIGICWDFGHANLLAADQSRMIESMGERIRCTHIHNNFGYRDDHSPVMCGNIDWSRAMSALSSIGYSGPMTLETECLYTDEGMRRSFYKNGYESLGFLERA